MGNDVNQSNVILRIANDSELKKFKTDLQKSFRISAEKEFGNTLDLPIHYDSVKRQIMNYVQIYI